ncbi:MAG: glycoside hydrolase family 88 protein [Lachnospiraceae bacterium]|nr:glycoside hydrolase family 88 protein [Lachnospiraceae bacterium]
MKPLFCTEEKQAVFGSTEQVIRTVLDRYMGNSPAESLAYRAYTEDCFKCDTLGYYDVDFDKIFPEAQEGDYAYAFAQYRMTEDLSSTFYFHSRNTTEIYVNGERCAKTVMWDEISDEDRQVTIPSNLGYNSIFIKCKKGTLGFGFRLGPLNYKTNTIEFYKAFAENAEELGWNYCGPFKGDIYPEALQGNPAMDAWWMPRPYSPVMPNIPGHSEMYAVSTLIAEKDAKVTFCAESEAEMELYIDGMRQDCGTESLCTSLCLEEGVHAVAVRLCNKAPGCFFKANVKGAKIALPDCVKNVKGEWLYLDSPDEKARKGFDKYHLYEGYEPEEKTYFLCGGNTYLRPVLESPQFGRLNYPNGVVLYGLLEAGDYLKDKDVLDYAHEHMKACYAPFDLALWNRDKFGWACLNHKIMSIRFLDDCGAFSAMVLEDYLKYNRDEQIGNYIDYVADYILNRQERRENGMFYRNVSGYALNTMVMWADDTYMSVPFMVRYAQVTGDNSVMDDAVNQLLCYKEKLYMEEHQLLGHVYSFKHNKCNRVPWGRGNGWVILSLTELLKVLPKEHKHYKDIETFFVQLAEGFLKCVDEEGMIHNVLWDKESFAEASATAMCAASFARGIRMGILPADLYQEASERSVEALKKYCIDEHGNVYGVCRGSGYSFREDYYRDDLWCLVNDTHGTGIVLIALIEVEKNRCQE